MIDVYELLVYLYVSEEIVAAYYTRSWRTFVTYQSTSSCWKNATGDYTDISGLTNTNRIFPYPVVVPLPGGPKYLESRNPGQCALFSPIMRVVKSPNACDGRKQYAGEGSDATDDGFDRCWRSGLPTKAPPQQDSPGCLPTMIVNSHVCS